MLYLEMRISMRCCLTGNDFAPKVLSIGLLLLFYTTSTTHGSRQLRSFSKSKQDVPARPNAFWEDGQLEPFFDNSTNRNVTTQWGKTAFLHCRVRNLGERSVSWIRHRDLHILTVGRYTYTTDQRFQAIHLDNTDDWTLQIKYPMKRDSGQYECQVSTEPKMSMFVSLTVIDNQKDNSKSKQGDKNRRRNKQSSRTSNKSQRPRHTYEASASIRGSPEMYIKSGNTINLTCDVTQSQQPQAYVFWHHNGKVINYDSPRGGINVETTTATVTTSRLLITNAKPDDSGNYTCEPANADSASIFVHVLNANLRPSTQLDSDGSVLKREKPGALQHGDQSDSVTHYPPYLTSLFINCVVLLLVSNNCLR
ncbi:hypothetical protein CHUAL_014007 [Chamberlinius hualienensis]